MLSVQHSTMLRWRFSCGWDKPAAAGLTGQMKDGRLGARCKATPLNPVICNPAKTPTMKGH